MAIGLESVGERAQGLPAHEASWLKGLVGRIIMMLDERDQFPDMLFDGRPYDEQTAHLRLLQYHCDSIKNGFSEECRFRILDIAIEFGAEADLPDDVITANWLKASEEL